MHSGQVAGRPSVLQHPPITFALQTLCLNTSSGESTPTALQGRQEQLSAQANDLAGQAADIRRLNALFEQVGHSAVASTWHVCEVLFAETGPDQPRSGSARQHEWWWASHCCLLVLDCAELHGLKALMRQVGYSTTFKCAALAA